MLRLLTLDGATSIRKAIDINSCHRTLAIGLMCVGAFASTGAFAQDTLASAEADQGLGEIIVTAQRKEESSQKVAVPIDVVSGDDLLQAGVTNANQLQQISPALNVAAAGGPNSTLFIRGVGNFSTNAYSDPATAFNVDGVYLGRTSSAAGHFYDLERIEVLKGPQGTLYGRNATAGAINVIPAKPKLGAVSGLLVASYGNHDALNLQGALNLPVGESSAIRVSGMHSEHDGFQNDGTSDENLTAGRLQFLTEITPDFTVRLSADYERVHNNGGGSSYDAIVTVTGLNQITTTPTGLGPGVGLLDPVSQTLRTSTFSGQVGTNLPPLPSNVYEHDESYGFSLDAEYTTPIGTISFIPAYRHATISDIHVSPGFPIWNRETYEQTSLELRLGGGSGIFDYVLGGYYFDESIEANDTINQQALASYQDFKTGTKSYALFGHLTLNVTDSFRLTGGYRYTHDKKSIDGIVDTLLRVCGPFGSDCVGAPYLETTDTPEQQPFPVPARDAADPTLVFTTSGGPPAGLTIRFPADVVASQSVNKSTFRAAAEYDLAPQVMAYASVETGFHAGGFSLAPGKETFKPETITAYTLGLKSKLLDNRLLLNVEVFNWDYKNQQVAHFGFNAAPSPFPDYFTENIGRARIKGAEVDIEALVAEDTRLHATAQYLDSRYRDFTYVIPDLGGPPPATGCTVTGGGQWTVDCAGLRSFNSPKWTLGFGIVQAIDLGGDLKLELSGDTQYRSKRVVGFEYLESQTNPGDWRSNASATLSKGDLSLTAFVRNIEGHRPISSSTVYNGLVTNRHEDPRTYGVRAEYRF